MTIHLAEVKSLLELADRLDQEGKTEEAASLHIAAQKLVQAAAKDEDEEKSSGGMTNKQKAAIRGFMVAAERVERAFSRGAPRGPCRKVDDLAAQVADACKECTLD